MRIEEIRASGLLEQYVLGELTMQEMREVDLYLTKYPDLSLDLRKIEDSLQLFAREKAITPPPALERSILDFVTQHGDKTKPPADSAAGNNAKGNTDTKGGSGLSWLTGLLALAAAGLAVLYFTTSSAYGDLQREHDRAIAACDSLELVRKPQIDALEMMSAPTTRRVLFAATDAYPSTRLYLHTDERGEANLLQAVNLPPIDNDQAYQLWSLKDGVAPIPLTVFDDGNVLIPVDYEAGTGTYAITIEAAGGATSPTLSRLIGTAGV